MPSARPFSCTPKKKAEKEGRRSGAAGAAFPRIVPGAETEASALRTFEVFLGVAPDGTARKSPFPSPNTLSPNDSSRAVSASLEKPWNTGVSPERGHLPARRTALQAGLALDSKRAKGNHEGCPYDNPNSVHIHHPAGAVREPPLHRLGVRSWQSQALCFILCTVAAYSGPSFKMSGHRGDWNTSPAVRPSRVFSGAC